MAEENKYVNRFACGTITRCRLAEPRIVHGSQGEFNSYALFLEGAYEDTKEPIEGEWFNSTRPVKVYEGGDEPINPKETDKLKFKGRILFAENTETGKCYLNAVSIEERLGEDDYEPEGNPFKDNPL